MIEAIKKKTSYFKGIPFEELKSLKDEDVLKILSSRGRRSVKRGLSPDQKHLMKKVDEANKSIASGKEQNEIKTHSRDAIILPKMLDVRILVHNGKSFEPVDVKPEMIGHYLGEFVPTRKRVIHTGTKKAAVPEGEKPKAEAEAK
jgi:small subunit ribosomal protein S19